MTNHPITLYHYWRSSCSWRVRWGLLLKSVPFNSAPVNLLTKEHQSQNYLIKNPSGLVPCLEVQGKFLSESVSILEWLDETYPKNKILPQDPLDRQYVRELSGIIASGIQPVQNLKVMNYFSNDQAKKTQWGKYWIEHGLAFYEKRVQKTAGTYSFGGMLTIADLCLIPQVYNAIRFKVDLQKFPIIKKIYDHCLLTNECNKAHPDNQPGANP